MAAHGIVGLELMWNQLKNDMVSMNDALIATVHAILLSHGFKCLGTGDKFTSMDDAAAGSEVLPSHWNRDQQAYVLRYKAGAEKKRLVLKAIPHGKTMLMSFLEQPGDHTAEMDIAADTYLTKDYKDFGKAFVSATSIGDLKKKIQTDVINKLKSGTPSNSPNSQRKKQSQHQNTRPISPERRRIPPPQMPTHGGYDFDQDLSRPRVPPVGGADLDPLGRGYGGSILDPRDLYGGGARPNRGNFFPGHPGPHLPPGAVPPGARFDPFGPPMPGPRPNRHRGPRPPPGPGAGPSPDMERPPDYDDMFM